MLSGVGPARDLQEFNIPIVQDLSGVGSHLVDHPVVDLYFKDKMNDSSKYLKPKTLPDLFKVITAVVQYFLTRRGALATNARNFLSCGILEKTNTISGRGSSSFYSI